MEDKHSNVINPVVVGLIVLQVIFIIFVVVAFNTIFHEDEVQLGVEVNSLEKEIEGLPGNAKNNIEYHIYSTVAKNGGQNIQNKGAIIRDGSLINNYYKDFDIHYTYFIVDIPEARQSYQVFYEWSENSGNKYISSDRSGAVICPNKDQLIYEEFACDHSDDYMRNAEIYNMLGRYGYKIPGMSDLRMVPESYASSSDFKVKLYYVFCESQCTCMKVSDTKKDEGVQFFKKFVEGFGFRIEDIPYYFDNCS